MSSNLQKFSAPILLFIHSLPRWVFPTATAVLLLSGLFVPNGVIGGILLTMLGLILGWLVALSWPLLPNGSRIIRVIMLAVTFYYTYGRFTGIY